MSGITQGYTDANIAIFGLSAKIKADFVGGSGDKVLRVFNDFNDLNDLNDFNAPDAIKKSPKILRGGEILLTLYLEDVFAGKRRFLGSFCTGTDAFAKQTQPFR